MAAIALWRDFDCACWPIEMIATGPDASTLTLRRRVRPSPRQSDLIIIAGTVTLKMSGGDALRPDPSRSGSFHGRLRFDRCPFDLFNICRGLQGCIPVALHSRLPPAPSVLYG